MKFISNLVRWAIGQLAIERASTVNRVRGEIHVYEYSATTGWIPGTKRVVFRCTKSGVPSQPSKTIMSIQEWANLRNRTLQITNEVAA